MSWIFVLFTLVGAHGTEFVIPEFSCTVIRVHSRDLSRVLDLNQQSALILSSHANGWDLNMGSRIFRLESGEARRTLDPAMNLVNYEIDRPEKFVVSLKGKPPSRQGEIRMRRAGIAVTTTLATVTCH